MAQRLNQDAGLHHERGRQYQVATMSMPRRKWNRMLQTVAAWKAREEAKKEQERQEERGFLGTGIGAGAGAGLSLALAPVTGGASLVAMPGMMAAGSQVGRGFSGAGTPADISSGFQGFQDPLTDMFAMNDPLLANPGPATQQLSMPSKPWSGP
jgi:hypothetical protein